MVSYYGIGRVVGQRIELGMVECWLVGSWLTGYDSWSRVVRRLGRVEKVGHFGVWWAVGWGLL